MMEIKKMTNDEMLRVIFAIGTLELLRKDIESESVRSSEFVGSVLCVSVQDINEKIDTMISNLKNL